MPYKQGSFQGYERVPPQSSTKKMPAKLGVSNFVDEAVICAISLEGKQLRLRKRPYMNGGDVLWAVGQQHVSVKSLSDAQQVTWIFSTGALHVPPPAKADGCFVSEPGSFPEVFRLHCTIVLLQGQAAPSKCALSTLLSLEALPGGAPLMFVHILRMQPVCTAKLPKQTS